ncbi:MAG: hypothetical protein U0326_18520 [Polyangiales bacterium]
MNRARFASTLALTFALTFALGLPACGVRNASTADASTARDVAPDVPPTRVGNASGGDGDCAGLVCATRFDRMCNGPIRPHAWGFEFPGGWCQPAVDLARGDIPGGCPAGSRTLTVITGCDGIPFRFCTRPCASDRDCRASEGYRCNLEALLCYPPALVTEEPDAGSDAGSDAGPDGP